MFIKHTRRGKNQTEEREQQKKKSVSFHMDGHGGTDSSKHKIASGRALQFAC